MVWLYSKENVSRRLLFATPSGERHEFGILPPPCSPRPAASASSTSAPTCRRDSSSIPPRDGVDVVVLGVMYSDSNRELRRQVDYIIDHLPGRLELWVGGPLPATIDRTPTGQRLSA